MWALSDPGKRWVIDRMPVYEDIRAPRGIDNAEAIISKKTKQKDWKKRLATAYMDNWPDFMWDEVVGENPSQSALDVTQKRPIVFISNYISDREHQNHDSNDILTFLFKRVRKPAAKDLWAAGTQDYMQLKKDALIEIGWTPGLSRKAEFPMQMKVRSQLFDVLPSEERAYWGKKADEAKTAIPTTQIYGLIGDALAKQLNFSSLVMAGGRHQKAMQEEFQSHTTENPVKFMGNDTWKGIEGAFRDSIAQNSNVRRDQVEQLSTWKPLEHFTLPVIVKLSVALSFNNAGEVISSESVKRKALKKYLDSLYRPPHFMNEAVLDELIMWILKGEQGLLLPEQTFAWLEQKHGVHHTTAVPRRRHRNHAIKKATKISRSCATKGSHTDDSIESIEMPVFSGSETESEEAVLYVEKPEVSIQSIASIAEAKFPTNETVSHRKKAASCGNFLCDETQTDTESGEDNGESEQIMWRGQPTHSFESDDYLGWLTDFENREILLDWDNNSLAIIDITSPPQAYKEGTLIIFGALFDTTLPVPDPADFPRENWNSIYKVLLGRVSLVLKSILNHRTNSAMRWLRLGGQGGVVNMLHAVEFAHRLGTGGYCPDILEDVKSVAQNMEHVFAQEAWQCWTLGSFKRSEHQRAGDLLAMWQIMMEVECQGTCDASRWFDMKWRRDSRPNIIDRIAEQAAIRIRGCRPEDTVLTLHNITWSMPATLQGMKEWTCTMSEGMFEQGSLLERFTYVYGLYMAAGWADGTETSEWCKNAVEETAEWMCKLRYHQYSQGARSLTKPSLGTKVCVRAKHKAVTMTRPLSATRVALLQQNDLTLKRMKCSPVHLEKAGGPFGHQILTPENIEGILSMSRIVPKKADCLNDEEQKDEEFSKPIATQYRKNPAEFNKALVLKIGTISCDHADKEKLGMTDLPVKHSDVISRKRPAETGSRLEYSLPLLKRIRDDDNDSIIEGQGKSWQNGVRAHIIPQVSSEGEGSTNTTIIAMQPPSGAMDQDGEHGVTLTTGPAGAGGHRQGRKASHVTRSGPNEKLVAAMGPQAKALHRHFGTLHAVGTLHTENENYIIAVFTQTIWVPTLKYTASDIQIIGYSPKDYMGAYTEVILKIPRIWDCFTWKGFLRFFEKTHNT
ncbi:hypothetical protein BU17DRAFT_72688 [Hysterangium stoloniferum]|nr:hypothetical protein BU17DRAFT_72688 [Hysterangium stoloniferum]